MPYLQHPFWGTHFSVVVRTAGDPGRIAQAMRRKVHERAPDVPVRFTTAEESLQIVANSGQAGRVCASGGHSALNNGKRQFTPSC
jgi:hypothetical protein